MAERSDDTGTAPSLFSERGWVIAAAMMLVLVAVAVILLVTSRGGGHSSATALRAERGSANRPDVSGTAKDPDASVCGLPAGDQEVPATPPDAHWKVIGELAAPSGAAGPGSTSGGLRSCYAHSPTGALFAATNFLAAESGVTGEEGAEALLPLFARTPALEEAESRPAGTCQESEASTERLQIAGFRITASNPDEVAVELALYGSSGDGRSGIAGMTMPMRWEQGDWKFVLGSAACGADPYNTTALENISGYVPWGGA